MDVSFLGIQELFDNSEGLEPEPSSERNRNEKQKQI